MRSFATAGPVIDRGLTTGIGNGAAHEMGHHLERLQNVKGNGGLGMPYMHCGLSALNTRQGLGPIACENSDNFVYGFFSADGTAQYADNPSGPGAMFLYGVLGGTNGNPVQPMVHWGGKPGLLA